MNFMVVYKTSEKHQNGIIIIRAKVLLQSSTGKFKTLLETCHVSNCFCIEYKFSRQIWNYHPLDSFKVANAAKAPRPAPSGLDWIKMLVICLDLYCFCCFNHRCTASTLIGSLGNVLCLSMISIAKNHKRGTFHSCRFYIRIMVFVCLSAYFLLSVSVLCLD